MLSEFHLALEARPALQNMAFGFFRERAEKGSFDQENVGEERRKPEHGAYSLSPQDIKLRSGSVSQDVHPLPASLFQKVLLGKPAEVSSGKEREGGFLCG